MALYERKLVSTLVKRMQEPRRFMQILIGARQTGKSTAIMQALSHVDISHIFGEASEHQMSPDWLRAKWYEARMLAEHAPAILVIDEVQYIRGWSDVVKSLWDEDSRSNIDLRVFLTGSAATLIKSGMDESLTGRFELIRSSHWSYTECRDAFGYSLDDFLFFGGYPGAASLKDDEERWLAYLVDSIIEPSVSKDVLTLEEVRKPELIRRLFYLGAPYSAQEISYRKLLGQLDDRGNVATIAHYLKLLEQAGLISGIHKFDTKMIREKASSPRLLVHDTALMTATCGRYRHMLLDEPERRGHLIESAIGSRLIARSQVEHFDLNWWREGNKEVDFVVSKGSDVLAVEVKSGRVKSTKGLTEFMLQFPHARTLVIGSSECSVEDFLSSEEPLF